MNSHQRNHKRNKNMWHGQTRSVEQTLALGKALGGMVRPGDLIALVGELGAGKTQFVRGMAMGMGMDPSQVASPTYVLVHEYTSDNHPTPLVHIDAYRLRTLADLESIGWDRPMPEMREQAVVVIEWADRLGDELGDDYLHIELVHVGDDHRNVTVADRGGAWRDRADELARRFDHALRKPEQPPTRPCPICKKPVSEDGPSFPFCSERCRTIDLAKWASGSYTISRPIEHSDLEEGE